MYLVIIAEDNYEEAAKAAHACQSIDMQASPPMWSTLYDAALGLGFPFKEGWKNLGSGAGPVKDWLKEARFQDIAKMTDEPITMGVITDVMMPVGDGFPGSDKPEPVGLAIAAACHRQGIPVVICTSEGGNHKPDTWILSFLRMIMGQEKLDEILVNQKDWDEAARRLKAQMDAIAEQE